MQFSRGVARINVGATTVATIQSTLAVGVSAVLGAWFWSGTSSHAANDTPGIMQLCAAVVWLVGGVTAIDIWVQHRWDRSLDTSSNG